MEYNEYYDELEVEKLINSLEYVASFQWSVTYDHNPTESELMEDGIYVEGDHLSKNFVLNIDGKPTNTKFRISVIPVGNEYHVKVRGFEVNRRIGDLVRDSSLGFGYTIDDYTISVIADRVKEYYQGEFFDAETELTYGVLDEYGNTTYDANILNIIYDYFSQYPNINNPYIATQKPLPIGENYITNLNHSDFINNNVANNNEGTLTASMTPNQLKSALDNLYNTDSFFQNVMTNSQAVRFCYRQVAPYIVYLYVNGYTIDNSKIVTTAEETGANQHYSALVLTATGGKYIFNPNEYGDWNFHVDNTWSNISINSTELFYNYPRRDFFGQYGFGSGIGTGNIFDSIGSSTVLNPVTPISETHTKWYDEPVDPSDPFVPVGHAPIDPSVPVLQVQTIVRRGIPPIIIKPRPIIGSIPKPYIDPVQPPTFDDDVALSLYGMNIYHPTYDKLSDFFDWLWDRDTWHDKQDMNSNPLESIISLHTLPLPNNVPYGDGDGDTQYWYATDVYQPIVLGYLTALNVHADPQTNIVSNIVSNRVCHFALGKVNIPRTYLDYRDFDREIYIYIPYVGFKQIRCDDVTPHLAPNVVEHFSELYLDYIIDVATGDFQAIISINKYYSDRKVLYTFQGNMATQIPLTATDKTRLEQARWNVLGGLSTTALSFGGAIGTAAFGMFPMSVGLLGAGLAGAGKMLNSINEIKNQNVISVERSGSLAGNFGALAPKTPYVVINAPIKYDTVYEPYSGDSANVTINLYQLKGFARCKYVHVDTLASVTLEERNAIEQALLDGVIF